MARTVSWRIVRALRFLPCALGGHKLRRIRPDVLLTIERCWCGCKYDEWI